MFHYQSKIHRLLHHDHLPLLQTNGIPLSQLNLCGILQAFSTQKPIFLYLTTALITANTAKVLQYMGKVSCNFTHA